MQPKFKVKQRSNAVLAFALAAALIGALLTVIPVKANATTTAGKANMALATSEKAPDVGGQWVGVVDCGKGPAELKMTIIPNGGTGFVGVAFIRPMPNSAGSPGTFRFRGEVQNGLALIRPDTATPNSLAVAPLTIDARLHANPDRLIGKIQEAGCKSVELHRSPSLVAQKAAPQSSGMAIAVPATPGEKTSATLLTYANVLKIIGDAGANEKQAATKLVGKTIKLTLIAPGPQSLMVNKKDGVFFACQKRDAAFKSGALTAKVVKYESPDDAPGPMITFEHCAN